jgi:tetraacyldisaccharide 4'-kinase
VTILRTLLRPLSFPYGVLARTRAWGYSNGFPRSRRLPGIVISVGNLTVGGTGKTPFVIWLTKALLDRGKHVAVLTRGYRGTFRGILRGGLKEQFASHPEAMSTLSDETQIIHSSLAQEPHAEWNFAVGVGFDRFATGSELGISGFDWFVLDDGFQHLQLARDLDILLIDATNPFGGGHLLPAGGLREPRSALKRADIIVITRSSRAPAVAAVIRRYSSAPIFSATMKFDGLTMAVAREKDVPVIAPVRSMFYAFAAIGNPAAFFENLREWNVPVVGHFPFPDHHKFSRANIARLEAKGRAAGADSLVCTKKDIFNLRDAGTPALPVWTCNASLEVHDADAFWRTAMEILKRRRPEIEQ